MDFGISKVGDANAGAAAVTATATVLGSPLYMSPEQMESAKRVDARSDIWSLGAMLYQLISGRCPFEEETLPGLLLAIATKEPRKLGERVPVHPELDVVIARCLAKSPRDRYQSVAELATALAPFAPNAREHVERTQRMLGASRPALAQSTPSLSGLHHPDGRQNTDPFGRTKTALAGTGDVRVPDQSMWPLGVALAVACMLVGGGVVAFVKRAPAETTTGEGGEVRSTAVPIPSSAPTVASSPSTAETSAPRPTQEAAPKATHHAQVGLPPATTSVKPIASAAPPPAVSASSKGGFA